MKLSEFDFRMWNTACKKYIDDIGLISNIMCDLIHGATDIIEDFEIELWTGFYDKNGKKIYEGDILRYKEGSLLYANYKEGAFLLSTLDNLYDYDYLSNVNSWAHEIIGNIHENPELLKC
ncbi:YopX family protein [Campylobacter armoricus]|uniref:YopX family protein n=1 Tax=Campylobacter armoricus TaxID=2505970 RepID=UPI001116E0E8|nr:YopX family protein [Campylobacter armoricus]